MKFLIDECLSPTLATLARDSGYPESTHVNWLNMRSRSDPKVARRAVDDGYVLVTNNACDFLPMYGREEVHVGLVCLHAAEDIKSLAVHTELFKLALEELSGEEPYNEVLEITAHADGEVDIERRKLPAS